MGWTITDDEFAMILLWSLPESYDVNVSQIMTAVDIGGRSVMPKLVIQLLTNEYNKHIQKLGTSKDFSNEAFCAEAWKKNTKDWQNIKCFNFHKKGHTKAKCWAKGGGREGQWPKKTDQMSCGNAAPKAATAANNDQTWVMEVLEEYLDINDNDKYSCSDDKESCANKTVLI